MQFLRRPAALVALIAVEGVAVVAVHRLGDRAPFDLPFDHLDPWLRAAPGDALAAALRAVALVCAWWLLLVTLAYAARAWRASRARSCLRVGNSPRDSPYRRPCARGVDRGRRVHHAIRRAVRRSHGRRSPAVGHRRRARREKSRFTARGRRASARSASVPSRLDVPEPPTAQPVDQGTVVVTTGDNLWDLSAAALARAMGRERASLGNDEIARYYIVAPFAGRRMASRIAKIFKLSRCLDELSDRRERAACLFPDQLPVANL